MGEKTSKRVRIDSHCDSWRGQSQVEESDSSNNSQVRPSSTTVKGTKRAAIPSLETISRQPVTQQTSQRPSDHLNLGEDGHVTRSAGKTFTPPGNPTTDEQQNQEQPPYHQSPLAIAESSLDRTMVQPLATKQSAPKEQRSRKENVRNAKPRTKTTGRLGRTHRNTAGMEITVGRDDSSSGHLTDASDDGYESDTLKKLGWLVDPWIDGNVDLEFTGEDVQTARELLHDNFQSSDFSMFTMHWAMWNTGGFHKNGSVDAEHFEGGKRTKRKCRGVFICPNREREDSPCFYNLRPRVKSDKLSDQKSSICTSGLCRDERPVFRYIPCGVEQKIRVWKHGAIFKAIGTHNHPRPSRLIRLSPRERKTAEELVANNPKLGPTALRYGRPGLVGPTQSLRSVSTVFATRGRIAYFVNQTKKAMTKGLSAFDQTMFLVTQLRDKYPHVVKDFSYASGPFRFQVQTEFMEAMACQMLDTSRQSNGLVTDAPMGYLKNHQMYNVIISSAYCVDMFRWVPVLITVTDGQSAEHYKIHFIPLLVGIHTRCSRLCIKFVKEMLAVVSTETMILPPNARIF